MLPTSEDHRHRDDDRFIHCQTNKVTEKSLNEKNIFK
jgi:hypothetical protein